MRAWPDDLTRGKRKFCQPRSNYLGTLISYQSQHVERDLIRERPDQRLEWGKRIEPLHRAGTPSVIPRLTAVSGYSLTFMEIVINLNNPAHLFLLALTVLVIMGSVALFGNDFPPATILAITLAVGGIMTIIFSVVAMVIAQMS